MFKKQLNNEEILPMIRKCYESDKEHMLKYHITSDKGLEFCINRTVADFCFLSVDIFGVYKDSSFIGYFGHEQVGNDNWLTGFFIMPEFRKTHKEQFWNVVKAHFNNSFKAGIFNKNEPARKFLLKNGCELLDKAGFGEIYLYKENE